MYFCCCLLSCNADVTAIYTLFVKQLGASFPRFKWVFMNGVLLPHGKATAEQNSFLEHLAAQVCITFDINLHLIHQLQEAYTTQRSIMLFIQVYLLK